jgi:hypothetical protein
MFENVFENSRPSAWKMYGGWLASSDSWQKDDGSRHTTTTTKKKNTLGRKQASS